MLKLLVIIYKKCTNLYYEGCIKRNNYISIIFPLFFNRKKYGKIKTGEIIYKLKDENINGINIEKLEKYIYDDLTFMKVCNMWKIVIKDMFHNFDENVLDIIYKVRRKVDYSRNNI